MSSGRDAPQDLPPGTIPADVAPRTLVILGATGSIGRSTARILALHPEAFAVAAVAGGRDAGALAETAVALGARFAALADPSGYAALKAALAGTGIACAAGPDAVEEAARRPCDLVIGAIAGTAGMRPTFSAIAAGRTIALANKETLVCAGRGRDGGGEAARRDAPAARQRAQRHLPGAGRRRLVDDRADDADGLGRPLPRLVGRTHRVGHAGSRPWRIPTGPWARR